jgi:hypothetical protein
MERLEKSPCTKKGNKFKPRIRLIKIKVKNLYFCFHDEDISIPDIKSEYDQFSGT